MLREQASRCMFMRLRAPVVLSSPLALRLFASLQRSSGRAVWRRESRSLITSSGGLLARAVVRSEQPRRGGQLVEDAWCAPAEHTQSMLGEPPDVPVVSQRATGVG